MNRWSALRQSVIGAAQTVLAAAGRQDVPVYGIPTLEDAFYLGPDLLVGVLQPAAKWDASEAELGEYGVKTANVFVTVIIYSKNERAPMAGLDEDGQTEDLADILLGTAAQEAAAGIRGINLSVGIPDLTPCYLLARGKTTATGKDRKPGSGGPIATVLTFETTTASL